MALPTVLSLALLAAVGGVNAADDRKTAALIIGGYFVDKDNPDSPILKTAELFGCEGHESIPVADLDGNIDPELAPDGVYLTGGTFVHTDDGGKVLICGGYSCSARLCQLEKRCMEWTPEENSWNFREEKLTMGTWAHLLAQIPKKGASDGKVYPVTMGLRLETELMNENGEWEVYESLPERNWYSLGCFTQFKGKIYSIRDSVMEIDPSTWTAKTIVAEIPDKMARAGKCAGATINGEDGIMLRPGFFFNLFTKEFQQVTAPPYTVFDDPANALWNFRGEPTIFGANRCDSAAENCVPDEVFMYDSAQDSWKYLGRMKQPREFHEVVEVPAEFCDFFVDPPTSTPPPTEAPPEPEFDTAALIVGGYMVDPSNPDSPILKSAELFGCKGYTAGDSFPVADLDSSIDSSVEQPDGVYLTAGAFMHTEDGGKVLLCGGYACSDRICRIESRCMEWTPATDLWVFEDEKLNAPKWAHIMAQVPKKGSNSDKTYPVVMGLNYDTEIMTEDGKWEPYEQLPERNWWSMGCLTQFKGKIYSIRTSVIEIDPTTWEATTLMGSLPVNHEKSGKCAGVTIDGVDGIMTQHGFFFDLTSKNFERKAVPPYTIFDDAPNAMWTFRGKPTVFGTKSCDSSGENCIADQVFSYEPTQDRWVRIGKMYQGRTFHEVIEVPQSFCDFFVDPPTTEVPTTEDPGTDEPGTEGTSTEEPGTDEPGTEGTSTEEPGTDSAATSGVSALLVALALAASLLQ